MTQTTHSMESTANSPQPLSNTPEVSITRTFDAPRELVFKAWTDAKQLAQWWGPRMFTTPLCELDVRPGGAILIHMRGPDGVVYPMKGIYREIVEPERLVYTNLVFEDENGNHQLEVLTTVTFAEHEGKTKITVREEVVKATTPQAEAALAGMEEGMNQSLDRLADKLQSEKGATKMAKTNIIAEPGKQEIVITYVLDAPRDLVFKAYTDPDLLVQWLGPRRLQMTVDKMDVRPGGSYRYTHSGADGVEHGFHGVIHDVVPSERIVQTFEYEGVPGHVSLDTLMLEELDGKTKITTLSVFQSVADRDGMIQSGMEEGVHDSIDRLTELLAKA